jgi:hypothetical protein
VVGAADPVFLQPQTGNLAPGPRLAPGWHPCLQYRTPTGRLETSTVSEVVQWVREQPPPGPTVLPSVLPLHAAPPDVLPSAPQTATPTAANPSEPVTRRRSPRLAVACLSAGVPLALASAGAFPPSCSPACSSTITECLSPPHRGARLIKIPSGKRNASRSINT